MTSIEVFAIAGSITSIILAVMAIGLSIAFYSLSSKSSKDVSSAVDRLDALFHSMYQDTFSIVKDQTTAMQRQLFTAPNTEAAAEIEEATQERIAQLHADIEQKISQTFGGYNFPDNKVRRFRAEMRNVFNSAIDQARQAEADEIARRAILNLIITSLAMGREFIGIVTPNIAREIGVSEDDVLSAIEYLTDQGHINNYSPTTKGSIRLRFGNYTGALAKGIPKE